MSALWLPPLTDEERAEIQRRVDAQSETPNPLISVPVPLADGRVGNLRIPKLLSRADADRIKSMVEALVPLGPAT